MEAERQGYWEPHSSSVEFCEPNYQWTIYCAEPHNVWSSAVITAMAVVGYLYSNPSQENRFRVMYLILGAVGIGSMALHTTLHWLPQSSDEVPMLWVGLSEIYALYTVKEERNSPRSQALGYAFLGLAVIVTIIYYKYRQIYFVFLLTVILNSAAVTLWLVWLTFLDPDKGFRGIRLTLFKSAFTSFVLIGKVYV
jgi:dihydroceramidase